MSGWTNHTGRAVVLPRAGIDTDQLIPARFMSTPRAQGYGSFLLYDIRRDETGDLLPDFPLNRAPDASILIAGESFGSGSSREAAVYALVDAGFRAVIAPSFGDIFASNAVNNGLLPARLPVDQMARLTDAVTHHTASLEIDLEVSRIAAMDQSYVFDLDESWRIKLINGWDDIDLTQEHRADITAFRAKHKTRYRWSWPAVPMQHTENATFSPHPKPQGPKGQTSGGRP